jgi:uncharacterized protein YjbJ (UPF0337 family)
MRSVESSSWLSFALSRFVQGTFTTVESFRPFGLKHAPRHCGKEKKNMMKPSTQDQMEGALHEMKGKVREKAGQVTGNRNLEAKGKAEKLAGKVQKKIGQIKKVLEA